MKKKILNIISIILLTCMLFVLSACTNNTDNGENIQSNEQLINTVDQEQTKMTNIVGEWKATKTNNDTYSLGWLYGTSLTLGNELKFNEDGTYSLGLGVTYWQEGKYEIDGTTIKLIENEYKGDNPDKTIAEKLIINGEQVILVENVGDNEYVEVIFENTENFTNNNDLTTNTTEQLQETTTNTSEGTTNELKIGNKTIKYGTYTGIDAATGDTLVINADNTATLNGTSYTYTVGEHNFAQDTSSDSYKDGIIFQNGDGSTAFPLYVGNDGSLRDDPMCYVYSEK